MFAQLYDDGEEIRIFPNRGVGSQMAMMDLFTDADAPIGVDVADMVLRRCKLRRCGVWKRFPQAHMYEAPVSFTRR